MKVRSLGRVNGLSECELEALLGAYQQYEFISQIFGTESQLSLYFSSEFKLGSAPTSVSVLWRH